MIERRRRLPYFRVGVLRGKGRRAARNRQWHFGSAGYAAQPQQVPRRAASKTPWTATARNERRVCAEGREERQRPAPAVIWLRACKRTKDNEVERAILTSRLNLCFLSSFLSVQYEKWMVYDERLGRKVIFFGTKSVQQAANGSVRNPCVSF